METLVETDIVNKAIEDFLTDYNELNPNQIDELSEEPTPLEFMRYVAKNRPFVIRRGAVDWPAFTKWNTEYLIQTMGDSLVKVAVTPCGNADSPLEISGTDIWFIKPFETFIPFRTAIERIQDQELKNGEKELVIYAQTQNDNLRDEYHDLYADIPKSIPFARIALQKEPDAVNFWLGNSRSVTALHRDPYENVYAQLKGRKHLVLLPPVAIPCINEQILPAASYTARQDVSDSEIPGELTPLLDSPEERVPFATWDPDKPEHNKTRFSHLVVPLRVTLEAGDILYLPALWYHKVNLSCGTDPFCCSVNYWFDMEYSGSFFPMCSFLRNLNARVLQQSIEIDRA